MKKKKIRFGRMAKGGLALALCLAACGGSPEAEKNNLPDEKVGVTMPVSSTPAEENDITPTDKPAATPTQLPTPSAAVTLTGEHPHPPDWAVSEENKEDTNKTEDTEIPENMEKPEEGEKTEPLVFSTVTPVPPEQVKAVAGTMTRGDFPLVDGSTATIPLSEAVYCMATGEDAEAAKGMINHTKTTNSYKRLYNSEVDLLIVYEPAQSIIERMQEEPLLIKPIGLDALVFMANAANPVESLTAQQLCDIYAGKISDWSIVGGRKQELLAFQRPEGSGSQTLMQKLVMGDTAMAEGDNVYRYGTMSEILEGMLNFTGDDNTLGYSVYYYASQMYHLPDLKFMGVNGVIPSTQTIYDGTYPYINAFYAVIRPDEPEDSNAHKIFDWLTGEEGQQMVLDLGYVPVIMPDGAQIDEEAKTAGGAQEIEISPTVDLQEGQHFIFFQKQNGSWEFDYGKVTVFDHKWRKCATFYNVETYQHGVYDGRYLSFNQFRAAPDGEEERLLRFYDLKEQCFLEEEWLKDAWLDDPVHGYFGKYPTEEERYARDGEDYHEWGKLYNDKGEVVLDYVPMYEGGMRLHIEGNCYVSWEDSYKRTEDGSYETYLISRVYDRELNLKDMICSHEEMLPEEKDRLPGVNYILKDEGCILSEDGELLLNPAMFLERFGDGSDMACEMPIGKWTSDGYRFERDPSELYEFIYKGKSYYVDRTLSFYWIEGEENGHLAASGAKGLPDYFVAYFSNNWGDRRLFAADGTPLLMKNKMEPDQILSCGDGYALAHIGTDAVIVEEHLPKADFCETYTYPAPSSVTGMSSYKLYYLGKNRFAAVDPVKETDNYHDELRIFCKGEETDRYAARWISLQKGYCQNHSNEAISFFQIEGGRKLSVEVEGEGKQYGGEGYLTTSRTLYQYLMLKDGKVCFFTEPGEIVFAADGYAQFEIGNYDIVYDMAGNIVLRAINRGLELD